MGGFYQLRAAELKHGRVVTGTQQQNAAGVFESPGHTNVIPAVRLVKIDICFYSLMGTLPSHDSYNISVYRCDRDFVETVHSFYTIIYRGYMEFMACGSWA